MVNSTVLLKGELRGKAKRGFLQGLEYTPALPPAEPDPRTHRGCVVSGSIHSQHRLEVSKGRDGVAHQGEIETQGEGGHRVFHTSLEDRHGREQVAKEGSLTITSCVLSSHL